MQHHLEVGEGAVLPRCNLGFKIRYPLLNHLFLLSRKTAGPSHLLEVVKRRFFITISQQAIHEKEGFLDFRWLYLCALGNFGPNGQQTQQRHKARPDHPSPQGTTGSVAMASHDPGARRAQEVQSFLSFFTSSAWTEPMFGSRMRISSSPIWMVEWTWPGSGAEEVCCAATLGVESSMREGYKLRR